MATLTLVNRVRALTNSTTSHTSNDEVVEFVRQGVRYVLSALPIQLASPFATDSTSVTSNPIYIDTTKIISVKRGSIKCIQVPIDQAYDLTDSNSLHLASVRYPAFYIDGNEINIAPAPSATATGTAKIVDPTAKASGTSTTDTAAIDQFDGIAIKYAAGMDMMNVSGYWANSILENVNSTEVTTGARDALTNAQNLIDNKTAYDAEDFLALEDAEMVASAVQTAAQEVNRALAEMRGTDSSNGVTAQMISKAQQFFNEADRELLQVINQGGINDASGNPRESRQQEG